jgi:hypothetical protein
MPHFITFDPLIKAYLISPKNPLTDLGVFIVYVTLADPNMQISTRF